MKKQNSKTMYLLKNDQKYNKIEIGTKNKTNYKKQYNKAKEKYDSYLERNKNIRLMKKNSTLGKITYQDYLEEKKNINQEEEIEQNLSLLPFIPKKPTKKLDELKKLQRDAVSMRRLEYSKKVRDVSSKKKSKYDIKKIITIQKWVKGYLLRSFLSNVCDFEKIFNEFFDHFIKFVILKYNIFQKLKQLVSKKLPKINETNKNENSIEKLLEGATSIEQRKFLDECNMSREINFKNEINMNDIEVLDSIEIQKNQDKNSKLRNKEIFSSITNEEVREVFNEKYSFNVLAPNNQMNNDLYLKPKLNKKFIEEVNSCSENDNKINNNILNKISPNKKSFNEKETTSNITTNNNTNTVTNTNINTCSLYQDENVVINKKNKFNNIQSIRGLLGLNAKNIENKNDNKKFKSINNRRNDENKAKNNNNFKRWNSERDIISRGYKVSLSKNTINENDPINLDSITITDHSKKNKENNKNNIFRENIRSFLFNNVKIEKVDENTPIKKNINNIEYITKVTILNKNEDNINENKRSNSEKLISKVYKLSLEDQEESNNKIISNNISNGIVSYNNLIIEEIKEAKEDEEEDKESQIDINKNNFYCVGSEIIETSKEYENDSVDLEDSNANKSKNINVYDISTTSFQIKPNNYDKRKILLVYLLEKQIRFNLKPYIFNLLKQYWIEKINS